MSQLVRYFESLGKSNGKKWSQIVKLLLIWGVKSPCEKKVSFLAIFFLTSRIFLVSVLPSALVERCFVLIGLKWSLICGQDVRRYKDLPQIRFGNSIIGSKVSDM